MSSLCGVFDFLSQVVTTMFMAVLIVFGIFVVVLCLSVIQCNMIKLQQHVYYCVHRSLMQCAYCHVQCILIKHVVIL